MVKMDTIKAAQLAGDIIMITYYNIIIQGEIKN